MWPQGPQLCLLHCSHCPHSLCVISSHVPEHVCKHCGVQSKAGAAGLAHTAAHGSAGPALRSRGPEGEWEGVGGGSVEPEPPVQPRPVLAGSAAAAAADHRAASRACAMGARGSPGDSVPRRHRAGCYRRRRRCRRRRRHRRSRRRCPDGRGAGPGPRPADNDEPTGGAAVRMRERAYPSPTTPH